MRVVYNQLVDAGYRVACCAPTGKAAKRIYQATGIEALTVHRLLEYPHPNERDPKTGEALDPTFPQRHKYNPLQYDVVLCDEYSMVNHSLHRNLLDALPRGGSIRMFGDVNQLPPIEEKGMEGVKSIFAEMLDTWPKVVLETLHRQGEGSLIVSNGARILRGQVPVRGDEFKMVVTDHPLEAVKEILALGEMNFKEFDTQFITPTKKRLLGSHAVNSLLQNHYNPDAQVIGLEVPRHKWDAERPIWVHDGDKVIWTENNYDLEIFNGEIGRVKSTNEFGGIEIDFGDRVIEVPLEITKEFRGKIISYDPRRALDLAYALTTHKFQGSECQNVLYMINRSQFYLLNRNNFYTGITRARKFVQLITDQKGLWQAVRPPMDQTKRKRMNVVGAKKT